VGYLPDLKDQVPGKMGFGGLGGKELAWLGVESDSLPQRAESFYSCWCLVLFSFQAKNSLRELAFFRNLNFYFKFQIQTSPSENSENKIPQTKPPPIPHPKIQFKFSTAPSNKPRIRSTTSKKLTQDSKFSAPTLPPQRQKLPLDP
jgi:hypothetical protein